jgi:hypothetical protein
MKWATANGTSQTEKLQRKLTANHRFDDFLVGTTGLAPAHAADAENRSQADGRTLILLAMDMDKQRQRNAKNRVRRDMKRKSRKETFGSGRTVLTNILRFRITSKDLQA